VTNYLDIHYTLDAQYPVYRMEIYDMTGKMLLQAKLPAGSGYFNLDVAGLTPGMYFLKCTSGVALVAQEKFIKIK
jgi:hypothetical protein